MSILLTIHLIFAFYCFIYIRKATIQEITDYEVETVQDLIWTLVTCVFPLFNLFALISIVRDLNIKNKYSTTKLIIRTTLCL